LSSTTEWAAAYASTTALSNSYIRALFSASSPVAYNSGTGAFSITADSIGDTELAFNTGQNLTTASSPTFSGLTLSTLTVTHATTTSLYASGNVGIGTTSPSATLAVAQQSAGTGGLYVQGFANNNTPVVRIIAGNSPNTDILSITSSAASPYLNVSAVGFVGVGTSTPSARLTVTNTTASPSFIVEDSASDTTPFLIDESGNVGIGTSTPTTQFQVTLGNFTGSVNSNTLAVFAKTSASDSQAAISVVGGSAGLASVHLGGDGASSFNNGRLVYDASTNAMSIWTSDTRRMVIDSSGNVGIGEATPLAVLSVGDTSSLTNNASTTIVVDGTALGSAAGSFRWLSEIRGNIGNTARLLIGQHRTSATASDWTTGAWRIQPAVDNSFTGMSSNKGFLEFSYGVSGAYSGIGLSGVGNTTPDVVVNSLGNVGIGTTSPAAKLGVAGGAYIGGNLTATGTAYFAGNVGIASTTPYAKLSVVGTAAGTILSLVSDTGTKFLEMLNTGVTTLLGTWDFGGADALEIPNGANPTANDPGEIAHDTTDNQLILDDRVIRTAEEIHKFAIGSTSPSFATSTSKRLPRLDDGYTVTTILCDVEGGTSKAITLFGETITCDLDGATDDGSIASPTMAANASTSITMATTTGAVNYVNVTIKGIFTRE